MKRTLVGLVLVSSVIAASCGSDDGASTDTAGSIDSSDASAAPADTTGVSSAPADTTEVSAAPADTTTGEAAADTPIKIMQIVDETTNTSLLTFPAIAASGRATVEWMNANGGIGGHPIDLTVCDTKTDPNIVQTCARDAVDGGYAAVVGAFSQSIDRALPILEEAGIAYIPAFAYQAPEMTSPISFPLNAATFVWLGTGVLAAQSCKAPASVVPDSAARDFSASLIEAGLASGGVTPISTVFVPQDLGDYSPLATQAAEGSDCIVSLLSPPQPDAFYPALAAAGSTARVIGYSGNSMSASIAKSFPELSEGAQIVDFFPPFTDDVWADYRSATETYSDPSEFDFSLAGAMLANLGFVVLRSVLEPVVTPGGEVTNQTVLDALNGASAVETNGILQTIDFTEEWDLEGFNRLFVRSVTFEEVTDPANGTIEWIDGEFHDMGDIFRAGVEDGTIKLG